MLHELKILNKLEKKQNNSIIILCRTDGRNPNFKKSYIGTIPVNINNIFRYDHVPFSKNILKKSFAKHPDPLFLKKY